MENVDQQVPPVVNQPPIKTSNNLNFAKTLAYGFVIVSIGISIAVGGYLLGVNKYKPRSIAQVSATPTPDLSMAPSLTNKPIKTPTIQPTSTSSNPLNTAKNPNWGDLKWIIVFTNAGEPLSENIKSDLCNGTGTNKLSYLPTWFKREANKYGVSLSISMNCYDRQITLPQNVITTTNTYYAFGQAIPVPLDMQKTDDYLAQTIPALLNYDLITIVHYVGPGASVADLAVGIGIKISYTFIVKSNLVDGVQYYAPNVTEPNLDGDPALVKGVAHEALHSLRAQDHYDYNTFKCSDETDKSSYSKSIMCAANFNNFTDYFVSPQTAKEIGWTN